MEKNDMVKDFAANTKHHHNTVYQFFGISVLWQHVHRQ